MPCQMSMGRRIKDAVWPHFTAIPNFDTDRAKGDVRDNLKCVALIQRMSNHFANRKRKLDCEKCGKQAGFHIAKEF